MERIPSADDFMASLWRTQNAHAALHPGGVARTPSQNEMETYFNAMLAGQTPQNVNALEAMTPREGTPTPGGIPRVASIDFLRKMIIGQQQFMGSQGAGGQQGSTTSPGAMTPNTAAALASLAASSGANLAALGQLAAHGGDANGANGARRRDERLD